MLIFVKDIFFLLLGDVFRIYYWTWNCNAKGKKKRQTSFMAVDEYCLVTFLRLCKLIGQQQGEMCLCLCAPVCDIPRSCHGSRAAPVQATGPRKWPAPSVLYMSTLTVKNTESPLNILYKVTWSVFPSGDSLTAHLVTILLGIFLWKCLALCKSLQAHSCMNIFLVLSDYSSAQLWAVSTFKLLMT